MKDPRRTEIERPDRSCRTAFTLIELLVTLAVIAILASLLLPGLSRARSRAHAVACVSNLRQLQLAWLQYPPDHQGQLSPCARGSDAGLVPWSPSWVGGGVGYWIRDENWLDRQQLIQPGPGHIGPYVPNPGVFHCPGDTSTTNPLGGGPLRIRSYAMNMWIGAIAAPPPTYLEFRHENDLNQMAPSSLYVLIDEHPITLDDPTFQMELWPRPENYLWVELPASRHNGGGTVSFADGHVELHRWLEESTRLVIDVRKPWPSFWRVPHSRDVAWLQERTTRWPWSFPP